MDQVSAQLYLICLKEDRVDNDRGYLLIGNLSFNFRVSITRRLIFSFSALCAALDKLLMRFL